MIHPTPLMPSIKSNSNISGAISCVLIAIKMITSDKGKIDHKKHIGDFFGGGGGGL